MSKALNTLVRSLPCPRCGAQAGERCRTQSGGPVRTAWSHADRARVLRAAYWLGLGDAADEAIDYPEIWAHRVQRRRRERGLPEPGAGVIW